MMAALITVVVLGLIVLLVKPEWISHKELVSIVDAKDRHDLKTANRDLVLKFIGGLGLIGTLALSALSYQESGQTNRIAQDTLRSAQQTQAADRYTKAIEQLGSASEAVRIGGIAALKSLLSDGDHHNAARDVLAAFVRANAKPPVTPVQPVLLKRPCDDRPSVQPPLDVQAAITALAERDIEGEKGRLDLRGAYLAGIELPLGARLNGALLDHTNLNYARMWGTELETVSLTHAQLYNACLLEAHMHGAVTDFSNFESAVLNGADLRGPAFRCSNLRRAGLIGARITGFMHTQLQGSSLRGAKMQKAILDRVDLTDAQLTEAHLEGASLQFANGLTEAQIQSAYTDARTELPMRKEPWPTDCG